MTEHPILFNAEMVRAIIDGRKTQTRRVIKFEAAGAVTEMTRHEEPFTDSPKGDLFWSANHDQLGRMLVEQDIRCPYGKPGDRLWVRETFYCYNDWQYFYRADGDCNRNLQVQAWKPSIHMPRKASRILLEVTDVRVERVQEISEEDCEAEGLKHLQGGIKSEFRVLWDSINAKRGYGWTVNSWCWVVSFRRIEQ